MAIDWGTVPEYLSGIGTVGTLAVAVWVLKRETDDRRERETYERGAQARLVRLGPVKRGGGAGKQGQYRDRIYEVELVNESPDAIHDVRLTLAVEPTGVLLSPQTEFTRTADVLAAGATLSVRGAFRIRWDDPESDESPHRCRPRLGFRDMSGQLWVRSRDYRLVRIGATTGVASAPDGRWKERARRVLGRKPEFTGG